MINWKYFFGGCTGVFFDRYYKAEINGQRVERHATNRGVKYSIGNMNKAKKKFKTESELIEACRKIQAETKKHDNPKMEHRRF